MKKDKTWFQLIGLKIVLVVLHIITLGIPKLVKTIDSKIATIANKL